MISQQAVSIALEAHVKHPRPLTQDPCAAHPSHHTERSRQCPGNPQTQKKHLISLSFPSVAVIWADHSLQRAKSCIFPGFGLTALTSYFHLLRHTMVLLLQHNNFDFVLFNKFLFLLGNSSILVLTLDRASWAFTQRYLGNSDCEDDCHKPDCGLCGTAEDPQGCRAA